MVDLLEEKVNDYAKKLHEEYNVPTLAIKCDTTNEDEVDAALRKLLILLEKSMSYLIQLPF
jgi:hypothetical protein